MKLLMIMALRSYQKELGEILAESNVGIYSELDLKGYKNLKSIPDSMNWFSSETEPESSVLLMVIADEKQTQGLMKELELKNNSAWEGRPCHAFQMTIENLI